MGMPQKEMIEELKTQWKKMWQERIDDKIRAEAVAAADYCTLFVEKGTVIHATRNYKTFTFKEILEQHQVANVNRIVPPDPQIGGWTKFVKVNITNQRPRKKKRAEIYCAEKKENQQPKKGGRGWLHL